MNPRVPITVAAMALIAVTAAAPVPADPVPPAPPPPAVDPAMTRTGLLSIDRVGPGRERLSIASAAMRRIITVDVLRGRGAPPRPVLYQLDGVEGADACERVASVQVPVGADRGRHREEQDDEGTRGRANGPAPVAVEDGHAASSSAMAIRGSGLASSTAYDSDRT